MTTLAHGLKFGGRYVLSKKLGEGSFGTTYVGDDILTGDKCAIKIEKRTSDDDTKHQSLLRKEYGIYRHFQGSKTPYDTYVPKLFWYGSDGNHDVLVIELLGPTLEYLLSHHCGGKFSIKTVCMIAMNILSIIKYVHSRGIVHRDIKPENFLIGRYGSGIKIIDFGLSTSYIKMGKHIEDVNKKKMLGTLRYNTPSAQEGRELSRRDDMISIGYMLVYFLKGNLPWQGLNSTTRKGKCDLIYQCKLNTSTQKLCEGLPEEFVQYFEHCASLAFTEKPNYSYLYSLFFQICKRYKYEADGVYDWCSKMEV